MSEKVVNIPSRLHEKDRTGFIDSTDMPYLNLPLLMPAEIKLQDISKAELLSKDKENGTPTEV
jgi:hypothetical protein